MADEREELESGSLQLTPTWAVAVVCSIFILASFGLERAIHYAGKWLRRHDQKPLDQALNKIKEELMLLGFISLLLTVFQSTIASLCMPRGFIEHMLPCKLNRSALPWESSGETPPEHIHLRRLLLLQHSPAHRLLQEDAAFTEKCFRKGKVPFLSREGLHELHIFIFVLAIVHVGYSCVTLLLGRYKIHGWLAWEKEGQEDASATRKKGRLGKRSSFVSTHADPTLHQSSIISWIVCFFRQFGRSPTKTDYKTLRHGFIRTHKVAATFDFHRYINRVLEDDFKKVVGVSLYLWAFVVLFLLLNINGWHTYFWIAFIPLVLTLIIGAKLQNVIMSLAVEIAEEEKAGGETAVTPRDELFWFNKPRLVLYILHFVLFQNAFELAFFFWIWATFGFNSCFMENLSFVIIRLVIGVTVQVLCSYITLPLYALVTQMGSNYKFVIFNEQTQSAITNWREKAKDKAKQRRASGDGASSHGATPKAAASAAAAAAKGTTGTGNGAAAVLRAATAAAAAPPTGLTSAEGENPPQDIEMTTEIHPTER